MRSDNRVPIKIQCLTLAATSGSTFALATAIAVQSSSIRLTMSIWIGILIGMFGASWWLRRLSDRWHVPPAVTPLFLAAALVPYAIEVLLRVSGSAGLPLEMVVLSSIQVVACSMAATSCWRRFQPLTMVLNLFVILFAASISNDLATSLSTGAFALFAFGWLFVVYWHSLVSRVQKDKRKIKIRWTMIVCLAGVFGLLIIAGGVRSSRIWALAGFMPSSGGDGGQDDAAYRGVGDGENLVSGENDAKSFGPIEDAPFRASHDPSLYDVFSELYDEPVKVKQSERSIALPPSFANQVETRMSKSERAGKEFSTVRKQRNKTSREVSPILSDALFYVKGRVPLHLRHELFDIFDGVTWYAEDIDEQNAQTGLTVTQEANRPWISWMTSFQAFDYLGPLDRHVIKVTHLKSKRVPSPLHLRGLHIDHLDRPDFFRVVGDQLLEMDVKSLPELTSIHLKSHSIDRSQFARKEYWPGNENWFEAERERYLVLPVGDEMGDIRKLAIEWAGNEPRGWNQVRAVVEKLRREYVLEVSGGTNDNKYSNVHDFLLNSRRGPDYMFATATCLLLRSLGYPTRLVGGFYASPIRYDSRKHHTAVVGADAHFWVEINHSGRNWITLEPTPGYELLGIPLTWSQTILAAIWSLLTSLVENWLVISISLFFGMLVWKLRARWFDRILVAYWTYFPAREIRSRILQTKHVIDRRLSIAGLRNRPGETLFSTLTRFDQAAPDLQQLSRKFNDLADWAAFAPKGEPIPRRLAGLWSDTCRQVINELNVVLRQKLRLTTNQRSRK